MKTDELFAKIYNDDLIGKTAMDVEIALDALLDNIDSFLETKGEVLGFNAVIRADLAQLWDHAYQRYVSAGLDKPASEIGFDKIADKVGQMATIANNFVALTKEKKLSKQARIQAVREHRRLKNNQAVTEKMVEKLRTEWQNLQGLTPFKPRLSDQVIYEQLKKLLTNTDSLGAYTHLWTIYERAWQYSPTASDKLKLATQAADMVVDTLYQELEDKQLRLRLAGIDLITVFFESRLFTTTDVPAPYIVAPYWGINLVWNWLAFGHEIGHHAYINIGETITDQNIGDISLGEELTTHVVAYLLTLPDKNIRQIWYHWIEEIFADLFCILRFGPVTVGSMQHMFFHLPPKGFKRFLKQPPQHRDWLLRADDDEHPIPYLRVYLAIGALQILEELSQDDYFKTEFSPKARERLRQRWNNFFEGVQPKLYHHFSEQPLSFEEMRKVGQEILRIMLDTPLYTLADKNDSNRKPRTLFEVFFDGDLKKIEEMYQYLSTNPHDQVFTYILEGLMAKQLTVRHILAALQFEFERKTAEETPADEQKGYLKKLSEDTIALFNEYEARVLEQRLSVSGV